MRLSSATVQNIFIFNVAKDFRATSSWLYVTSKKTQCLHWCLQWAYSNRWGEHRFRKGLHWFDALSPDSMHLIHLYSTYVMQKTKHALTADLATKTCTRLFPKSEERLRIDFTIRIRTTSSSILFTVLERLISSMMSMISAIVESPYLSPVRLPTHMGNGKCWEPQLSLNAFWTSNLVCLKLRKMSFYEKEPPRWRATENNLLRSEIYFWASDTMLLLWNQFETHYLKLVIHLCH